MAVPWGLVLLTGKGPAREATPAVGADLVDGCRRGDRASMEAVFRAHAQPLARLLRRIVGPSAEIEDLLQETFANAITAFKTFRGEASIKTWLHRIAIHVAHQHLRRPRHCREVSLDSRDDEPRAGAERIGHTSGHRTTSDPHDQSSGDGVEERELARRLYVHLEAIDATKRIALTLFAIEGYSVDEIAALMKASRTATRSRIFWARRALMKRMERDPFFAESSNTRGGGSR